MTLSNCTEQGVFQSVLDFCWHLLQKVCVEMDTFQFDVALLITISKIFHLFLSAVYSPWKNLCVAQNKLLPRFLSELSVSLLCSDPPCCAEQPSLCCISTNPVLYYHVVPSTFTFGTISHKRCKLFQPS